MTQEVTQPGIRKFLYQKAAHLRVPISGTFELTPRCNMNCRMCYIRMSEQEMRARGREYTAEDWIAMGRTCTEAGMLFLLLTGGEPFLRPDFRQIFTALSQMGLVLSINSNGTLITRETVDWLKTCPPSKINITLYGGSNAAYERLCGHPRGFDAMTEAVDRLLDAGIFVNINASFTKYNIDEMDAMYACMDKRGLPINAATYMFPPVRSAREGVTDDEVRFTPEEAGMARLMADAHRYDAEEFQRRLNMFCAGVRPERESEECEALEDEHMGCAAGKSAFWITWDGRMTPCGMMNDPVVRPFETGFADAWKSLCAQTDAIMLPPACANCSKRRACMVCGALTKAEGNGDSRRTPTYLCGMTDAFLRACEERRTR